MLSSSSHHDHDDDSMVASDLHLRQLLLTCADLISRSDFSAARRLLSFLSANSSPCGDATQRLVHQFTNSLSLRLAAATTPSASIISPDALRSSYLSLNQITPFVRFCHLTANQAILEATHGHRAIHILDFDIMHGVQWPPLMQAIAELSPPPTLRITGTGSDPDVLRRTGDRLLMFAHSLGLRFQFHPLVEPSAATIGLLPEEALAVNCVLYLHRLPNLTHFLHNVKALTPKIVTVAEREPSHHRHAQYADRFAHALEHYAAVFESLEATVAPNSAERMAVEQVWLGREIGEAAGAGEDDRYERFDSWEAAMRSSGFSNVPLSPFALSQAKLLLRLHYPSEGYQINPLNNSFYLSWRTRPLFSVSSWQ